MGEESYHPDDPALLVSRSLDEALAEDERQRLDRALAGSETLREEARRLRAVDQLIRRWGGTPVELDGDHHAALIQAEIASESDRDALDGVDRLLQRWGGQGVVVDEDGLEAAVMRRVRAAESKRLPRLWFFRLGAPLAAAAAIVLAVLIGFPSTPEAVRVVRFGKGSASVGVGDGGLAGGLPHVVVAFARTPVVPDGRAEGDAGISFGSVGSGPTSSVGGPAPPL